MADTIRITILTGLHKHGRNKTFAQILDAALVEYTAGQELEAANALESLGLIESVTYALPVEIRADLTSYGREYIEAFQNERRQTNRF